MRCSGVVLKELLLITDVYKSISLGFCIACTSSQSLVSVFIICLVFFFFNLLSDR